ncbi:MAG: PadR family transcriptional regulator [Chloroflexi bacterium]|nr:PadR family transcriptional regulator [Chloroflexota bacterium]
MDERKLTELEYMLLHFLAEAGQTHPYHLGRQVEDRGGRGVVSLGALYKALHRLEGVGCVRSEWEDVDPRTAKRPKRRLYTITGVGEGALTRTRDEKAALYGSPLLGDATAWV